MQCLKPEPPAECHSCNFFSLVTSVRYADITKLRIFFSGDPFSKSDLDCCLSCDYNLRTSEWEKRFARIIFLVLYVRRTLILCVCENPSENISLDQKHLNHQKKKFLHLPLWASVVSICVPLSFCPSIYHLSFHLITAELR